MTYNTCNRVHILKTVDEETSLKAGDIIRGTCADVHEAHVITKYMNFAIIYICEATVPNADIFIR